MFCAQNTDLPACPSITVEAHPYFAREADDIAAEIPVTVPEAYLGAHDLRADLPRGL